MNILNEIKEFLYSDDDRCISQRVHDKSVEVISKIDDRFFNIEYECYPSKFKTLIIDFTKGNDLLSLEIGYKSLGYFTEGKINKMEESMNITTNDEIYIAVKQIEVDLENLFFYV